MSRIYIVGSHSSGKTTCARYISKKYSLPMVSEVARSILAEWEVSLDNLFVDIGKIGEFQKEILKRQYETEKKYSGNFVSDRAFDSLAYAAEHTLIAGELLSTLSDYIEWVKGGIIFFIRPHQQLLKDDGIRATSHLQWDSVVRIDGMVKLLLEIYNVDYIPIHTSNMQERVRIIRYILDNTKR